MKRSDTFLARVFFEQGGPARSLCNGLGRCGRCRVRFLRDVPAPSERDAHILSEPELAAGWRMACQHSDCRVPLPYIEVPPAVDLGQVEWLPGAQGPCRMAVDLGTTSIEWRLVRDGETLGHGRSLNPQGVMGAEVMSRLACAMDGGCALRLSQVVTDLLKDVIIAAKGHGLEVDRLAVAGNSVMTSLLLEQDISGLAAAPYRLDYQGGREERLKGLPPVYVPPLAGPFMGADLTAGLAWLIQKEQTPYPFLLLDLGTNGECVLALNDDHLLGASVAMGPALEGVGLSCGRLAGPGVVTQTLVTPTGLSWLDWEGRQLRHPEALSGSGALSLVQALLSLGLIQEDGRFAPQEEQPKHPLAARIGKDVCLIRDERAFCLDESCSVRLTASDVEQLLKVKAAANVATTVLLQEAGLGWGDLAAVRLAGALGKHMAPAALEGAGWLPPGLQGKTDLLRAVGNSALEGAALLCEDERARQWIEAAARRIHVRNLAELPAFQTMFLERMTFRHVV